MSQIRESLELLANSIEELQNAPAPTVEILDRSLSGNKIHGGKITKFSSIGITDDATRNMVLVSDDGLFVDVVHIQKIKSDVQVDGDLSVKNLQVQGELHAKKIHVDELSADVRNERTGPLEFKAENGSVMNKGLIWTGQGQTKQLTIQGNPDRLFSSETIDLARTAEYRIGNQTVLSSDSLGTGIKNSSLRKVGMLEQLEVSGSLTVNEYLFYDSNSMRFGLGTDSPNGALSVKSLEHEFVIDHTDSFRFKIGSWTTSGLDIITDDTVRISIDPTGSIKLHNKTVFHDRIGVRVKNFGDDADITSAGPIRFQNKKFEVGHEEPSVGSYQKGDIIWNDNPQPTGYIGWVCVRDGTPGAWKPFGQISR